MRQWLPCSRMQIATEKTATNHPTSYLPTVGKTWTTSPSLPLLLTTTPLPWGLSHLASTATRPFAHAAATSPAKSPSTAKTPSHKLHDRTRHKPFHQRNQELTMTILHNDSSRQWTRTTSNTTLKNENLLLLCLGLLSLPLKLRKQLHPTTSLAHAGTPSDNTHREQEPSLTENGQHRASQSARHPSR